MTSNSPNYLRLPAAQRSRAASQRGAALVEMAISFALLFAVISLLVDLGWGIRRANTLLEAARAGARDGAFRAAEDDVTFWCNSDVVPGLVPCSALPNATFTSIGAEAATKSACDYVKNEGGFDEADWEVAISAVSRSDVADTQGLFRGAGLTVRIRPTQDSGIRGCLLCFGGLGQVSTSSESTFLVNHDCN